jgi:transcription antitermination factor NusG
METRNTEPLRAAPLIVSPWYGIRVKSNFEQVTAAILRAKGYEEYVPLLRARRRWSDRVKEISTPLFPGYVFCRFDPSHRLPIIQTTGFVNIISFDGVPAPIPDEEIDTVRRMVESKIPVSPHPFLRSGQKIRINRGPLAGVEGMVVEVKKEFRIVASITLLQRSVSVEINREWIDSIS